MKETKYRAWDKKQKMMYDVAILTWVEAGLMAEGPCIFGNNIVGKDCELMQYIGLKDKNDVKIAEGDILENLISHIRAEVKWRETICGFIANALVDDGYECPILGGENILIIGNIYENSELLKERKNA